MAEFRVGRGHDGPARIGEFILGEITFETPLLTSYQTKNNHIIKTSTLGRDEVSEKPMIVSLPFISDINDLELDLLRQDDVYLLPYLSSFGSLSSEAPATILDYQAQISRFLSSKILPSQMILRVPPEISPDSLSESIKQFQVLPAP